MTATSTDGSDTAQTVDTFDVTVNAVADAPTVTATDVSGNEDTAIALDIASGLTDTDGSESLSVVVSGVPSGATLSAGTDNGDGTWTLTQAQLTGLTLTPPANSDGDFTLTVTSTDGSDTAQCPAGNELSGISHLWFLRCGLTAMEAQDVDRDHSTQI